MLRPFMFAMYTKSEENWSHINGVMSKKRKPKAMKRTIVVVVVVVV